MVYATHQSFSYRRLIGTLAVVVTAVALAFGVQGAAAAPPAQATTADASPLHPTFALLDAAGSNVLDSGAPISTLNTCGECHDTAFIKEHSFHADLGLSDFGAEGLALAQPWDGSRGAFGKWDPLSYRTLTPAGAERPPRGQHRMGGVLDIARARGAVGCRVGDIHCHDDDLTQSGPTG